jgi:hypothetical protein
LISRQRRAAAISQFAEPLQRALTAFAHGRLQVEVPEVGQSTTFSFNGHEPTPLRVRPGASKVGISIQLSVRLEDRRGEPYVKTTGWSHALFVDGVDRLRYDWHPFVTPQLPFPHVHINDEKLHLPTGRILVEDLLVAGLEYGALPISEDWKSRLMDARRAFAETAEWGQADAATSAAWLDRWDQRGAVVDSNKL